MKSNQRRRPASRLLKVSGYGALFDRPDMAGDIVRRGAFSQEAGKLIRMPNDGVMMLYQHSAEHPVGRWTRLEEDRHGLFVEGEVALGTRLGRDLGELLSTGVLDGLSIGFRPRRVRKRRGVGREILALDLWEISLVTFPMAPGARITSVN